MDNNYIELYSADDKEGVEIKGKDVIMLDAPEVRLSHDTPLLTNAQDVAGAINELFQLDPGGGDEWVPPDEWLPIPEPGPYEMYFLIALKSADYLKYEFRICRPSDINTGNGPLIIDWDDGTVDSWESGWSTPEHTYSAAGMYLIKATVTDESNFLQWIGNTSSSYRANQLLLMAKLGSEILLTNEKTYATQNGFASQSALRYVSLGGKGGLPAGCFSNCYTLQKVIIQIPLTEVKNNTFNSCYKLASVDISKATTIGDGAFYYCRSLKKANAPACTSVGSQGFYECISLKNVNVPLLTSIESQCFYDCYSLSTVDFPEVESVGYGAFQRSGIRLARLPKCTTVGNYGFSGCYGLDAPSSIEVAEGCTFGSNCFYDTYIYPEII